MTAYYVDIVVMFLVGFVAGAMFVTPARSVFPLDCDCPVCVEHRERKGGTKL